MTDRYNQGDGDSSGESTRARRISVNEERLKEFLTVALEKQDRNLREHIRYEFQTLESLIKSAFVEGDVHGHRLFHEADKKRSDRWEDIKAEFITKAFTAGALAAAGFVVALIFEYIRSGGKP